MASWEAAAGETICNSFREADMGRRIGLLLGGSPPLEVPQRGDGGPLVPENIRSQLALVAIQSLGTIARERAARLGRMDLTLDPSEQLSGRLGGDGLNRNQGGVHTPRVQQNPVANAHAVGRVVNRVPEEPNSVSG